MTQSARAIADTGEGIILATVDIEASPERVFRALTTADELTKWWGEDGVYRTTAWSVDLRVGGRWRAEGLGADGAPFSVEGEFVEIEPPHRLVQTWRPDWDGGHTTTITYRVEAIAEGSRVTVRHTGFGDRAASCSRHADGWQQVLGWLGGFAASREPPAAKYFFCRLIGPRPTFAFDMNDEERKMMGEHAKYWRDKLEQGKAVVFGPVHDPAGPWGLGVVRVADEAELRAFEAGDPVISSGRGFRYEVMTMMAAVHG